MPPESVNTIDPIIQRLRAVVKQSPELKDAAQLYEAILPLLRDADLRAGPPSPSPPSSSSPRTSRSSASRATALMRRTPRCGSCSRRPGRAEAGRRGARAERVFNAATVWGAKALGRDDLGKIAPGAKADIVILDLRTTRYGPARDPVNALVEYGSGADVQTVIVNGQVVIEGGRSTRIDEDKLFAEASAAAKKAWDNWSKRDWAGRSVEEINPPAFPTRRNK